MLFGFDSLAGASKALALYNRVVWRTLYRETMGDLRYGLTLDIRKRITADLQAALATDTTKNPALFF